MFSWCIVYTIKIIDDFNNCKNVQKYFTNGNGYTKICKAHPKTNLSITIRLKTKAIQKINRFFYNEYSKDLYYFKFHTFFCKQRIRKSFFTFFFNAIKK